MQGLQLIESALRGMEGAGKALSGPDASADRGFLEALLDTDALRDSGLTVEDLEAWLASQGGKGLPLGGRELPLPGEGGQVGGESPLPGGVAADGEQDEAVVFDLLALGGAGGRGQAAPGAAGGEATGGQQGALAQMAAQARLAQLQQAGGEAASTRDVDATAAQEGARATQALFQQALQNAQAQPPGVPTYTVPQSMDQAGWGQALGERLVMMAGQETQQARIQLNPRELGPLDVRIQMGEERTTITIQAQNAVTREALDAELPRLRAMLADNGIEDAEVDVRRDDPGADTPDERPHSGYARGDTEDASAAPVDGGVAGEAGADTPRSLVDHYA